jgi:hypothetical protein
MDSIASSSTDAADPAQQTTDAADPTRARVPRAQSMDSIASSSTDAPADPAQQTTDAADPTQQTTDAADPDQEVIITVELVGELQPEDNLYIRGKGCGLDSETGQLMKREIESRSDCWKWSGKGARVEHCRLSINDAPNYLTKKTWGPMDAGVPTSIKMPFFQSYVYTDEEKAQEAGQDDLFLGDPTRARVPRPQSMDSIASSSTDAAGPAQQTTDAADPDQEITITAMLPRELQPGDYLAIYVSGSGLDLTDGEMMAIDDYNHTCWEWRRERVSSVEFELKIRRISDPDVCYRTVGTGMQSASAGIPITVWPNFGSYVYADKEKAQEAGQDDPFFSSSFFSLGRSTVPGLDDGDAVDPAQQITDAADPAQQTTDAADPGQKITITAILMGELQPGDYLAIYGRGDGLPLTKTDGEMIIDDHKHTRWIWCREGVSSVEFGLEIRKTSDSTVRCRARATEMQSASAGTTITTYPYFPSYIYAFNVEEEEEEAQEADPGPQTADVPAATDADPGPQTADVPAATDADPDPTQIKFVVKVKDTFSGKVYIYGKGSRLGDWDQPFYLRQQTNDPSLWEITLPCQASEEVSFKAVNFKELTNRFLWERGEDRRAKAGETVRFEPDFEPDFYH